MLRPRNPLGSVLIKHVIRAAWGMRVRLFAVGCIAAFGLSMFVGSFSAISSILRQRDQSYATGHLADLELRVEPEDIANFPAFADLPGGEASKARMVYPGSIDVGSMRVSVLLIADAKNPTAPLNTFTLMAGQNLNPTDAYGVLIDRSLAVFHQVSVGQTLAVKLGKSHFAVHVRGIAQSSEFLLAPANPSLFVPSKGSLGVLYANPEVLDQRFGFIPANSVLFRLKSDADIAATRLAISQEAQKRLNVDWTMSRTEQFSYRFLNKDLNVFGIVLPLIVAASGLSTFFVASFLFAQWIARERQTIGIFMALGYQARQIALAFGITMAMMGVGALMGGLLWSLVVMGMFAQSFSTSVGLPLAPLSLDLGDTLFGCFGLMLLFGLAGMIALRMCLVLTPLAAMRTAVAQLSRPSGVSIWLGNLCQVTWMRLALRNVLRTPWVSLMTVISVALGFAITAAFFISFTSFISTSLASVEQNTWTLIADFVAPVWNEDIPKLTKGLPGVTDVSPYVKGVAQAVQGQQRENVYIGGFDPKKPWMAVTVLQGQGLAASDPQGGLIEESLARELGIHVGENLRIEARGMQHSMRVRGIISGALPGQMLVPIGYARTLGDIDGRSTGLLLRTSGDSSAALHQLEGKADVAQVLSKNQVEEQILAASGHITDIIRIGSSISMLIAVLFVFACASYTVSRRKNEYQTLRMIGYSNRIIIAIIVTEVSLLGLLSALLALPLSSLFAQEINRELSSAWFHVDTFFTMGDYLKGCVPGCILLPFVAYAIARGLVAQPLDTFLRTREIA